MSYDSPMAAKITSPGSSVDLRAARLTRIAGILFVGGAIALSLLAFPSVFPWMIFAWLAAYGIHELRGRPSPVVLLLCGGIVIIENPYWPANLVILVVLMVAIASFQIIGRRNPWLSAPKVQRAGIASVLLAWGWFAWDYAAAVRSSNAPRFDPSRPVVCLGDSLTAYGYPKELADRLHAPVVDLGVDGITTADALKLLGRIRDARPQAVVVELGGHDFLKGRSRAATAENFEKIIKACRSAGAAVILMEIPRGFVRDPFGGLERELARHYDLDLISDTPIRNLILWSPYAPPGMWCDRQSLLSDDGLHPNQRGNAYLADRVGARLTRIFGQARDGGK